MKNRIVNFSSNRKKHHHHSNHDVPPIPMEKRLAKSNKSLPFTINHEDGHQQRQYHTNMVSERSGIGGATPGRNPAQIMNKTDREETNTVHTIEDVTGRLSNLVRLMDENSKIIQPSDLTVQSYESQSVSAYNNPNNIYGLAEEHEGIDFQ